MIRALVKPNAVAIIVKTWNLPAHVVYTTEQHRWIRLIDNMCGQYFPIVDGIVGGIQDCEYLLIDEKTVNVNMYKIKSRVVAVPKELIQVRMNDDTPPEYAKPPIEESSSGAWWKEKNLEVVRLITSWVDGFMAFTTREENV
jgi:hypothetical protein